LPRLPTPPAARRPASPCQAGIERCGKLRILLLSNNKIKDYSELERLAGLGALEDLLLVGNPVYADNVKDAQGLAAYRVEVGPAAGLAGWLAGWLVLDGWGWPGLLVLWHWRVWAIAICCAALLCLQVIRRVPQLKKLDGIPVDVDEREQAQAAAK
jgi:hypothetical protein